MRIALACLVATACSSPASPPAKPPSQKAVRTPVSSTPTCADMGPLLRGSIDDEEVEGPKKEAIIVAACERDRWSMEVLACAASATEPTVQDCLDKLQPEQLASYDKALGPYGRDESDPPPDDVSCEEALAATAVDAWPPAITAETDRPLAIKLRQRPLRQLCNDHAWPVGARQCIADTPAANVSACLDLLDGTHSRDAVTRELAAADSLLARTVKVRAKPANASCEKVVAAHYANASWTGKAPELTGAERAKVIKSARASMLSACKGWSLDTRACIVASGAGACFALEGIPADSWGYPPASLAHEPPHEGQQ